MHYRSCDSSRDELTFLSVEVPNKWALLGHFYHKFWGALLGQKCAVSGPSGPLGDAIPDVV